ncbi:MAG: DNA cytosine methyltransferase [Chloroflexi bacterium]|uniref:DNA cytosine methyltransferase n=1 Tax=Candidatus Flexifilum breve TaxID=3140694 RepID=UPI003135402D|nr:DNA cytosine methyltransferase [Chloroflexota bacterium]
MLRLVTIFCLTVLFDAPNLGIPQTRRRLIIVGIRRDLFDRFHILKQYQYSSGGLNRPHAI